MQLAIAMIIAYIPFFIGMYRESRKEVAASKRHK
jgi:hypothetical protein